MKKIIFLTEGYKATSLPNAICLKKIVDSLECLGNEVFIISSENKEYEAEKNALYFVSNQKKISYNLNRIIRYPVANKQKVKHYTLLAEQILENNEIDLIVSVVNPIETAEALRVIKKQNPNVKCCLYEIDPSSNRYKHATTFTQRFLKQRARSWERKAYSCFDTIIHMKSHKEYYSSSFFESFSPKTMYLDIPALSFSEKSIDNPIKESGNKCLIYAGAFYKDLRNPKGIIKALVQMSFYESIDTYMYINDNMFDDIVKMINNHSEIHVNHYISEEELNKKITDSIALLSVGNKDSDFLPSKIFTYMSTGKAIIHFSFDDYDVAVDYLKRYPKSIILDCNNDDNGKAIVDFLNSPIVDVNVEKEFLRTEFYENTPEYTAKEFVRLA